MIYILAETQVNQDQMNSFFNDKGIDPVPMNLACFMGRLCYDSFDSTNNANITKRRADDKEYIENIIKQKHFSVLEHIQITFLFTGVSRVFTHELVRHRIGAFSQESMRYVRFKENPINEDITVDQSDQINRNIFLRELEEEILVHVPREMFKKYKELESRINWEELSMKKKKEISSLLRRILPQGIATNIGWSTNIRNLAHVIKMRNSPHAEVEIRNIFSQVQKMMEEKYPTIFPLILEHI